MKRIHQIYISNENKPFSGFLKERTDIIKNFYSDYEYYLYDNSTLQNIIKEHFDPIVLTAYNDVIPYTFKADIARMCLLYVYGGYYFDLGITIKNFLDMSQHELALVQGVPHSIHTMNMPIIESNFLFVRETHNPIIKKIIDKIVDNVYRLNYGIHPLDITSPIAIGRVLENIKDDDILYGEVRVDENENKSVWFNNKHFYDFKPKQYDADISQLGATGTNNYSILWHSNQSFNIRLSYVMITNNSNDNAKKLIEQKSIKSILNNLRTDDELIVVGNISHLKETNQIKLFDKSDWANNGKISHLRNYGAKVATGNVVINLDNDVLLPNNFCENLLQYIKNNKDFDTLNTKMYLPNGGRCWDRAIYNPQISVQENINSYLRMVDYNSNDEYFWYNGPLIIRKKHIGEEVLYDETIEYRGGEEIHLSQKLKKLGYNIKIDTNNYVFHADTTLSYIRTDDGIEKVVKNNTGDSIKVIKNSEIFELYRNLFKSL